MKLQTHLFAPEGEGHGSRERPGRSVLVALGEGREASLSLERGVAVAEQAHGRLTVMHVLAPTPILTVGGYLAPRPVPTEAFGLDLLERAIDIVGDRVPIHTVLRRGQVTEELLRRIDAAEHDVVVVGRCRPWLSRLCVCAQVSRFALARSGARVVVAS